MLRCNATAGVTTVRGILPLKLPGVKRAFISYNGFTPDPPECCQFKGDALRYRPAFILPTADHMVQFPLVVFIVEYIHNNLQMIVRHDLSLVVGKEGAYQEE